jgi:uncharacterized protein
MGLYIRRVELGKLIRKSRKAGGLTQAALSRRASTTQPAISQYENGRLVPDLETASRLLAATGNELFVQVRPLRSARPRVLAAATAIKESASNHGLSHVRLFGSVARGEDRPGSDIDLLVDPMDNTGLLDLFAFASEVEELLGGKVRVDVSSSRSITRPIPEAVFL